MTTAPSKTPPTDPATITEHEAEQIDRANTTGLTPVVFIHGLWLLPSSWDRWTTVFEEAGYTALTPGWPDDPETVDEANANPEVFAHKTVGQVADHYDATITRLTKKPAVIGHSFGGLLAQIIAGRGLAAASVAIDPAPFRGVLPLPISALKSSRPVLGNPANRNRAVPLTYEQFRFGFANAVSEEEAKELYDTFAVPAAGAPLFQAATANLNPWTEAKVNSKNPDRGPLLIIRREGQHGPVGDRQRVVQETEAQRWRDRDHRDPGPRARAHDRQRLARGRGPGTRVRPALCPRSGSTLTQVDRGRLRATLYSSGRRIWRSPIGVGKAGTPTPAGRFWIREKFRVPNSGGLYGPRAFGTAAYSGLSDWPGGGVIGIHGTNEPQLIPGRPSHGCIRVPNPAISRLYRLMPIGTPMQVR
jgi:non-heme chloroperoxidase